MTDDERVSAEERDIAAEARHAGCEAVHLPNEDGNCPGTWHFSQKFDEGIRWKRLKWPWVALRASSNRETCNKKNFSRQLASAETFLKIAHPEALVPASLIKENLQESASLVDNGHTHFSQGELLALGATYSTRNSETGKPAIGSGYRRLCLVFASGALRTNVSVAHMRWSNVKDRSGSRTRVPLVTEKSRDDTRFTRPILQIVFPLTQDVEDLPEYFAVRTETELDILTCSKSKDPAPLLRSRIRLPTPLADDPTAKYIAYATVSPYSPQVACIADSGFWAVHSFQPRKETHKLMSSGRIIPAGSMMEKPGVRRWKIEWNEPNNILIMENLGLYVLELNTRESQLVLAAGENEQFRSFALINSLRGLALAVLTLSEILIVDMLKWQVLLRQKHRHVPDPTLIMMIFTSGNVINILIYSNLHPVVTVHQVSEDFPLSWVDTPFELPLPRNDPAGFRAVGNLGMVTIPCNTISDSRNAPRQVEDGPFTTYRLQNDLSIIGDLYGPHEQEISRFKGSTFRRGSESYSSHLTTTDAESESDDDGWSPYGNTRVLDLSSVACEFLISKPIPVHTEERRTRYRVRNEVVDQIKKSDIKYDTLNQWQTEEMWKVDVDELTSAIEQISHSLEDHHYKVNHLAVDNPHELDPEDDPGSVSYMHKVLVSTIPKTLGGADLMSKLCASREIAIVVGLANVGIAKPAPSKDNESFSTLRHLHGLDADIAISEGSKSILETWGERPEVEGTTLTTSKPAKKRVKFEGPTDRLTIQPSSQTIQSSSQIFQQSSQRIVTPSRSAGNEEMISMSQPVRGKFGDTRRKLRKSGF